MKLLAPKPGWTARADVIVVGSGVAGLTTALQIRTFGLSVLLVTKARVDAGSTKWAQGGIAAALGPGDSPGQHENDTLDAGAGLCDREAVEVLVSEGPEAVRKLIARGAVFDKEASGEIALTREGGHHRNRILHAGGDATGAEVLAVQPSDTWQKFARAHAELTSDYRYSSAPDRYKLAGLLQLMP